MRRFMLKTASVFTFILSILVLEGWLMGWLPLVGTLALLPAFALLTFRLFAAGTRPARRPARRAAATQPRPAARPALRVVQGRGPNGPRAA